MNTGKVAVSGLLIYTYYQGGYRAAVVAQGLAPGESAQVDNTPTRSATPPPTSRRDPADGRRRRSR